MRFLILPMFLDFRAKFEKKDKKYYSLCNKINTHQRQNTNTIFSQTIYSQNQTKNPQLTNSQPKIFTTRLVPNRQFFTTKRKFLIFLSTGRLSIPVVFYPVTYCVRGHFVPVALYMMTLSYSEILSRKSTDTIIV